MDTVYDVCVVGAGVMGSSTARHLAKLGKKTILLEQVCLYKRRGGEGKGLGGKGGTMIGK